MIRGKWLSQGDDISDALYVRARAMGAGRDETDCEARQAVIYDCGGMAVGTGRLWWQDGGFWMSGVCVLHEKRGCGYGDLLARLMIFKALSHGAREISLVSPQETAAFFARYGFRELEARDGGVLMALSASDARLSHCGSTPR